MRISARPGARASVLLACAVATGALIGCSSASTTSTKPGFCADRANLQNAIKGLTSLTASSGVSGLKSQVDTIQNAATALVNSAKSDFPGQTSAITSSVDALKSSVADLPANPSAAQIATITKDAASVVSSVTSFMSATSTQCG
jgi:hypothetical protein